MTEINDNTRLIRFLKEDSAKKTIGVKRMSGIIEHSFHFGLLSDYKKMETNAGDSEESNIKIDLGCKSGVSGCCGDVLVSCWSVWNGDEKDDPWDEFKDSSFTKKENGYLWAVTSTIGKVRNMVNEIVKFNKMLFGKHYDRIFLPNFDGKVNYYPEEKGVNYSDFQNSTDPVETGDIFSLAREHILYKRNINPQTNQRYDAEREYRFAMMLYSGTFWETGIEIKTEHVPMKNYPIKLKQDAHYIDKIYTKHNKQTIEKDSNCGAHINMIACECGIEIKSLDD